MKKINFLVFFAFLMCVIGCSETEQAVGNNNESIKSKFVQKNGKIVSPDGFIVAENLSDLESAILQNNKGATIASIDFVNINNSKGAIAFIGVKENGVVKKWGFAIGDVKVRYTGDVVTLTKGANTNLGGNSTTFKCTGSGCCYVGGTTDLNTGENNFYCKCENNPNGNSGCSLTVETSTGKQKDVITPGGQ